MNKTLIVTVPLGVLALVLYKNGRDAAKKRELDALTNQIILDNPVLFGHVF